MKQAYSNQPSRQVLSFFGTDLEGRNAISFLTKAHKSGYELLALDSRAFALAASAEIPCTVTDDWLSPEITLEALNLADECERQWFEAGRDHFTIDDVCWPEIDRSAMHWFWQNAMMALALTRSFSERNCRQIMCRKALFPNPTIGCSGPPSVHREMFHSEFPGQVRGFGIRPAVTSQITWPNPRLILGRVENRLLRRNARNSDSPWDTLDGRIVLVFSPLQEYRFRPIIKQLEGRHPNSVAAVLSGPYPHLARKLASEWSIPVLSGPPLPVERAAPFVAAWPSKRTRSDIERGFLYGLRNCVEAASGKPWQKPLEAFSFHFEYYCRHRWPTLCGQTFAFWKKLFRESSPRALLIPMLDESVYGLCGIAAGRSQVATVGLPEGGIRGIHFLGPLTSDYLLFNNLLQKKALKKLGLPESRMLGCRDLVVANEYQAECADAFWAKDKLRVLGLANPTDVGYNIAKHISLKRQLEGFRILASPPSDLANRLDLRLKVHPHYTDLELITVAGKELATKVLPASAELKPLLQEAELVVAVNYNGTALIHVARAAKPIIYLMTESEALRKRPDKDWDVFLDASTVVLTAHDFWSAVRKVLDDPTETCEMSMKSKEYAGTYLSDRSFPGLPDLLDDLLGSHHRPLV